ncbi:GIY-YIG nuclease family protein [Rhizobium rhizogenes]|uniref:GIY-YIG nuclease family protein n=1 Tax=Rhizobium rhizogenes TaxID=359 RepID=UPI001573DEAB|nr:GIY-YIG nuclease family protein [Rhizobium rhizogenes]NTF67945.1 hypothetical protein [Rhizobium rhizogenes]
MTVYFIRRRSDPQELIKIGVSTNLERRIYAMETAHPEGFDVLCTLPGGKELENYFHERFAADRILREWFKPTRELSKLMSEIERIGILALPEFAREDADEADTDERVGSSIGVSEAARCLQYMIERHGKSASDIHAAYTDIALGCGITFWAVKHLISGRAKGISIEKFESIKRAYLNHLREEKKALDARIEREEALYLHDFVDEILIFDQIEALAEKVRRAKGR